MKKSEVNRLYKFSDAHLITLGTQKLTFMMRDAVQFTAFGITSTMISDIQHKIDEFSDTATDIELLGEQTEVTEQKAIKADQIRVAIRNLMGRVELKYTPGSARYKRFGTGAISQLSDSDLLVTAKRVVRVATQFSDELEINGLTQEMITNIATLCHEFETLILDLQVKMGDRDIMQEDRVEAGNAIYSALSSYTATGRVIWETTDVAKYNDYIIYDVATHETPTVPTTENQ